jgi:hypothetical protein
MALTGTVVMRNESAGRLRRPAEGGGYARAVVTPIVSRVGASGMQWTSLVETSALDAAANLGASPDSRCKDIP